VFKQQMKDYKQRTFLCLVSKIPSSFSRKPVDDSVFVSTVKIVAPDGSPDTAVQGEHSDS